MKNIKVHCGVIALPAKEKTDIVGAIDSRNDSVWHSSTIESYGDSSFNDLIARGFEPRHLYVTLDSDISPIELGGWCLLPKKNISKCTRVTDTFVAFSSFGSFNHGSCKKIIASTDTSLGLPVLPYSLIEEYCKLGKIRKLIVDFQEIMIQPAFDNKEQYLSYRVKTNVLDEIIISPVERISNEENIQKLLFKALFESVPNSEKEARDWIKNNLE